MSVRREEREGRKAGRYCEEMSLVSKTSKLWTLSVSAVGEAISSGHLRSCGRDYFREVTFWDGELWTESFTRSRVHTVTKTYRESYLLACLSCKAFGLWEGGGGQFDGKDGSLWCTSHRSFRDCAMESLGVDFNCACSY